MSRGPPQDTTGDRPPSQHTPGHSLRRGGGLGRLWRTAPRLVVLPRCPHGTPPFRAGGRNRNQGTHGHTRCRGAGERRPRRPRGEPPPASRGGHGPTPAGAGPPARALAQIGQAFPNFGDAPSHAPGRHHDWRRDARNATAGHGAAIGGRGLARDGRTPRAVTRRASALPARPSRGVRYVTPACGRLVGGWRRRRSPGACCTRRGGLGVGGGRAAASAEFII